MTVARHEPNSHVSLLVTLLVRYPEISTVHVTASESALELSFLARGAVDPSLIHSLEQKLRLGLNALSRLDGLANRRLGVRHQCHDALSRLVVCRTLSDLVAEEFPIILSIVKEAFGERLIVDGGQCADFELLEEEESIGDTLDALRAKAPHHELIGIRDGGRVLVFNEAKL